MLTRSLPSVARATVPPPLTGAQADPLSYLAAVVRGEIQPTGLSSLEVNLIATEILDAARESARTGKRIELSAPAKQIGQSLFSAGALEDVWLLHPDPGHFAALGAERVALACEVFLPGQ